MGNNKNYKSEAARRMAEQKAKQRAAAEAKRANSKRQTKKTHHDGMGQSGHGR